MCYPLLINVIYKYITINILSSVQIIGATTVGYY